MTSVETLILSVFRAAASGIGLHPQEPWQNTASDLNVSAAELEKYGRTSARICTVRMTKRSSAYSSNTATSSTRHPPVSALSPTFATQPKWSWDKILRSPFIKQADVLQDICFFGDRFSMDEKPQLRLRTDDRYQKLVVSLATPSLPSNWGEEKKPDGNGRSVPPA